MDRLENAFVDIVGEFATDGPVVDISGEEEPVAATRPFLDVVILTVELVELLVEVITTDMGIFLVFSPSQEDTETLVGNRIKY